MKNKEKVKRFLMKLLIIAIPILKLWQNIKKSKVA